MKTLTSSARLAAATIFALLASGAVHAQPLSRGDLLKNRQYQSAGTLALFVDGASGNDGNACTSSGSAACATIQGAINKLPKMMTYGPATITVASGNYTGFYLDSFRANNGFQTTGTYVQIDGTLITATVATGSATGTATGGSAGSGVTYGTLVDSGQTWTVNDLRGKLVCFPTNAGTCRVVQSNTGTTITVTGTWSSPSGQAYVIYDWGTIINTAVNTPAQNSFTAASASTSAAIMIGDVGRGEARVTFRWLKMTTARSVRMDTSARVLFQESRFEPTVSAITINRGSLLTTRDSFSIPGSGFGVAPGANAAIDVVSTSSFWRGSAGTGVVLTFNSPIYAQFTGDAFENLTDGIKVGAVGQVALTNNRFDTITGNCIDFLGQGTSTQLYNSGTVLVNTSNFATCGTAINVRGLGVVSTIALTGSSNTTIYSLLNGGQLAESSSSTITGTTEISLDGTTYTIAALRAATPKSIVDLATLSRIWEP